MQYKLLASDYDNTLVPFGEHFPRPAVVKAVKKMQAAGGKFVLSTGRSWSAVRRKGQLGGIRFDYAIANNGACVVDRDGAIIAEHPMTNEEMYALVDFCEDYNYPLQFDFKDAYYAYCEYDYLKACYDHMNSPGLECIDGEDQDRHLIDMPHAAFAVLPPAALAEFNKKYGHLDLHWMQVGGEMPGGWYSFDIVRGGIDKGVGLADRMVSGTISLPCSGFFSPFLHSTRSLSVSREYLALPDGPGRFAQDSSCPALLRIPLCLIWLRVQDYHLL